MDSNDTDLWGQDLTMLPDLQAVVQTQLEAIENRGARAVVQSLKGEK